MWHIWKMRNDLQFNDKSQNENLVATTSLNFAREVSNAFETNSQSNSNQEERLTCWILPCAGCIKINTDGSSSLEDQRGGFGGIVRTDKGKWVEGFCGYIGYANALKAELWGIRHALKLCKERNWKRIVIESDCLNVVNLIKDSEEEEEEENHPNRVLIDDCRTLTLEMEARLTHIPRRANKCADALAHMGSEQTEQEVRILIPPNIVVEEMQCDLRGAAHGRV